jgi:hypothetical protein
MKAMSPGVAWVDDAISAWQWGQTMCVERGPSGIIVVMILGPVSEILEHYSAILHNSSPVNAPCLLGSKPVSFAIVSYLSTSRRIKELCRYSTEQRLTWGLRDVGGCCRDSTHGFRISGRRSLGAWVGVMPFVHLDFTLPLLPAGDTWKLKAVQFWMYLKMSYTYKVVHKLLRQYLSNESGSRS